MSSSLLAECLDAAVAAGRLGSGQAHRVALVTELARTLSGSGAPSSRAVVSGEALGRSLRLSRAAIHKHVDQLRSLGFGIASLSGEGYRLERTFADLVAAEAVLPFLFGLVSWEDACVAGLPYHYVAACGSTNAELRTIAAAALAGATLVTDRQTGGRGRLGRTWTSGAGEDLTFSVLLRPSLGPAQAHLLSLAAALAVAEVLEGTGDLGGRVGIKWPNDVLVGGKKICGILLEGSMDSDRLQWVIAGIGLNVNSDPAVLTRDLSREQQTEWSGKPVPTSLREELGHEVARAPLLAELLAKLNRRWTNVESGGLLSGLRRRDVLAGRRVHVLSGPPRDDAVVSGEALGIGSEGQLLVRDDSGRTVPVFAGDVTL